MCTCWHLLAWVTWNGDCTWKSTFNLLDPALNGCARPVVIWTPLGLENKVETMSKSGMQRCWPVFTEADRCWITVETKYGEDQLGSNRSIYNSWPIALQSPKEWRLYNCPRTAPLYKKLENTFYGEPCCLKKYLFPRQNLSTWARNWLFFSPYCPKYIQNPIDRRTIYLYHC